MNDIMKAVFKANRFEIKEIVLNKDENNSVEISDSFFAISKTERMKKEYFLVIQLKCKEHSVLEKIRNEEMKKYYDNIRQLGCYEKEMDKNTSLILCMEVEKLNVFEENENLRYEVMEMEEDEYYFKKYVISFTPSQAVEMRKRINDSKTIDVNKELNKIIFNREEFKNFKINQHGDGEYNLVSKLFIKLPFLKLEDEKEELEDLKKEIDNDLGSEKCEFVQDVLNMSIGKEEDEDEDKNIQELILKYGGTEDGI